MLRSKARFGLSFRLLLARSQASLTSLKVSSNVRMSVCDCCIRADTSGETKSAQASESARKKQFIAGFAIVVYFFLAREIYPILNLF